MLCKKTARLVLSGLVEGSIMDRTAYKVELELFMPGRNMFMLRVLLLTHFLCYIVKGDGTIFKTYRGRW